MKKEEKKRGAPPRYDAAFKVGALKMVAETGRSPQDVAKDLGICIDTLRSWMRNSGGQFTVPNSDKKDTRMKELEAENRALRKRLGEKEEVIVVLKKSVGILSNP